MTCDMFSLNFVVGDILFAAGGAVVCQQSHYRASCMDYLTMDLCRTILLYRRI